MWSFPTSRHRIVDFQCEAFLLHDTAHYGIVLLPLISTNSWHVILIERKIQFFVSSISVYLDQFLQFLFENISNESSLDFVNIKAL